MKTKPVSTLLLHNIRSVHNVGAIFRTADAVGISEIILSGYTPAPLDRFGNPRKDFKKTALGAELAVPWRKIKNPTREVKRLRAEGFYVIAIEQGERSWHYHKIAPRKKTLFVLGNEVPGLSQELLADCDVLAEIPMRGRKESLNVAVAAGVALYGILERG